MSLKEVVAILGDPFNRVNLTPKACMEDFKKIRVL